MQSTTDPVESSQVKVTEVLPEPEVNDTSSNNKPAHTIIDVADQPLISSYAGFFCKLIIYNILNNTSSDNNK